MPVKPDWADGIVFEDGHSVVVCGYCGGSSPCPDHQPLAASNYARDNG